MTRSISDSHQSDRSNGRFISIRAQSSRQVYVGSVSRPSEVRESGQPSHSCTSLIAINFGRTGKDLLVG